MICSNCGEPEDQHTHFFYGLLCNTGGTAFKSRNDVSTLPMRVAAPVELPDDSHTTRPDPICLCGISRIDCTYHRTN